jgi:hypothetical protein
VPTFVEYTLTATKGAETATRTIGFSIQPAPPLSMDHFFDDFEGSELDATNWVHQGGRTYSVSNSRVNWNADGDDWGHGEIDTINAFPIPPAGKETMIHWEFGPADVTVIGDGGALRPMIGISSAFETNNWSRQHWQNTTGGVWLDVTTMSDTRLDGVSATTYSANDTKIENMNGTTRDGIDIPDWNWKVDTHFFTLSVTDQGFTWLNGASVLSARNWVDVGIDTEFSKGFKILAMAGNWSTGRGPMSLDSVEVVNGAFIPVPNFKIVSVEHDSVSDETSVTFNAVIGVNYALDKSTDMIDWVEVVDETATMESAMLVDGGATETVMYYRIRNADLLPL